MDNAIINQKSGFKMRTIKIGDTVRLKGSPEHSMTVIGYLSTDSILKRNQKNLRTEIEKGELYVECYWLTSAGRPQRDYFHESTLNVTRTSG